MSSDISRVNKLQHYCTYIENEIRLCTRKENKLSRKLNKLVSGRIASNKITRMASLTTDIGSCISKIRILFIRLSETEDEINGLSISTISDREMFDARLCLLGTNGPPYLPEYDFSVSSFSDD